MLPSAAISLLSSISIYYVDPLLLSTLAETRRAAPSQLERRLEETGSTCRQMQIARPDPRFPVFPLDSPRARAIITDYHLKVLPISTHILRVFLSARERVLIGLACARFLARLRQNFAKLEKEKKYKPRALCARRGKKLFVKRGLLAEVNFISL